MAVSDQNNQRDKRTLLVGGVLIVLVGVYFVSKSFFFADKTTLTPQTTDATSSSNISLIAPEVLLKKIQNGDAVTLLDIRPEAAYQLEHMVHALSVPIGSLENFSPTNANEMVVIVFSENDLNTFETAKNIMNQKSFAYFFLKGGFEAWKNLSAPVISTGDPNSFVDQSKVTYLSLEECKKLLAKNTPVPFILDVQSESNFHRRHLKGAVNIPLDQLEKRIAEIPAGKQIIVYGENDLASFQGGVRLSDLGIFSAHTLTGGKYLSGLSGLALEP